MNLLPKFYRKYVYRKLYKRYTEMYIYKKNDHFLCYEITDFFPYFTIDQYPEIYYLREFGSAYGHAGNKGFPENRRVWFSNDEERIHFLECAIKLCEQ